MDREGRDGRKKEGRKKVVGKNGKAQNMQRGGKDEGGCTVKVKLYTQ